MSKLRRALGDPALITGGAAGYTLRRRPRLRRRAGGGAAGRVVGCAGPVMPRRDVCATALAMFRGEILPAAGDGAWLAPHRARLDEARLRLTEEHLAARVDLGAAGELVGELEALVGDHPLREGLWTLLITALYRAGRQADALAAYRRVRQQLADELGLDPGPELQALEQQVLRHDRGPGRARPPAAGGNLPGLSALADRPRRRPRGARPAGRRAPAGDRGRPGRRGQDPAGGRDGPGARPPGGAGWSGWRTPGPARRCGRASARRSGSARPPRRWSSTGCAAWTLLLRAGQLRAPASPTLPAVALRMLGAAPGLRMLATSQLPLGHRRRDVYHARAADAGGLGRRCSPSGPPGSAARSAWTRTPAGDRGGLPVARRAAAGDRAGRRAGQGAVGPGDRPPARTTGSPCWATRPAAGRRGSGRCARPSHGATTCCSPTTSAGCGRWPASPAARRWPPPSRCWPRSACPRRHRRRPGPARRPVAGRRRRRRRTGRSGTGCWTASGRSPGSGCARRGEADVAAGAHAAWFAARGRPGRARACADRSRPSTWRWSGPSGPTSTPRWPGRRARPGARRCGSRSGSAGPGRSSAPDRTPRSGSGTRVAAPRGPRRAAGSGDRRCCSPGGWRRPAATWTGPTADIDARPSAPATRDAGARSAGCTWRSSAASRAGPRTRWTCSTAAGPTSAPRPGWEEGAGWLLTAWARDRAGRDRPRPGGLRRGAAPARAARRPVGAQPRRGLLGALAQAEHRYADAVAHCAGPPPRPHASASLGAEAQHLANLGRA